MEDSHKLGGLAGVGGKEEEKVLYLGHNLFDLFI